MSYERSSAVFIRSNIVAKVTKKTADYYQFFYTGIVLRPNIKFQVVYFLDIIMADQPCQINTYFYCCFEQMYQFSFLFVTECNLQHLKVPSTLLEIMKKSQKLINEVKTKHDSSVLVYLGVIRTLQSVSQLLAKANLAKDSLLFLYRTLII